MIREELEGVLRSCTSVKAALPQCRNALLQVEIMPLSFNLSKSAKVLASKYV